MTPTPPPRRAPLLPVLLLALAAPLPLHAECEAVQEALAAGKTQQAEELLDSGETRQECGYFLARYYYEKKEQTPARKWMTAAYRYLGRRAPDYAYALFLTLRLVPLEPAAFRAGRDELQRQDPALARRLREEQPLQCREFAALAQNAGQPLSQRLEAAKTALDLLCNRHFPQRNALERLRSDLQWRIPITTTFEQFGRGEISAEELTSRVLSSRMPVKGRESPTDELVALVEQYRQCRQAETATEGLPVCIQLGTSGSEAALDSALVPWQDGIQQLRALTRSELIQVAKKQADALKAVLLNNDGISKSLSAALRLYDTEKRPVFNHWLEVIQRFPEEEKAASALQEERQEIDAMAEKLRRLSKELDRWYNGDGTPESLDLIYQWVRELEIEHGFKSESFNDTGQWMLCISDISPTGDRRVSEMSQCLSVPPAMPDLVSREEAPAATEQEPKKEAMEEQGEQRAVPPRPSPGTLAPPDHTTSSTATFSLPFPGNTAFARLLEDHPELRQGQEQIKNQLTPYRWSDFLDKRDIYPYWGIAWSVWEGERSSADFDREDEKTIAEEVAKLKTVIHADRDKADKIKQEVNQNFLSAARALRNTCPGENSSYTRMLLVRYFSIILWRLERGEHMLALDSVSRAYWDLPLDAPTNAFLKALGKAIAQDGGLVVAEQWDGERGKLKQSQ